MNDNRENHIEKTTEGLLKVESEKLPAIEDIEEFSRRPESLARYKKSLVSDFYSTLIWVLTHKKYQEKEYRFQVSGSRRRTGVW